MIISKLRSAPGVAFAVAIACGWLSQTAPVASQEDQQQPPAASDQAAPEQPAPEQTAPAAEPAPDGAAPSAEPAPSPDSGAATPEAPAAEAPAGEAAAPPAEAAPEATAPPSEAAAPSEGAAAISASQVPIGAAVFGSDGAKIGEINGVKSDDSGKVQEILVTDGVPAGMNAKVFEISADKIVSATDGVKLSLSSEEAKQLPIIDNSSG
ncbi:PRC-barrel domain-containing protein [Hyphomicrobium sp.]|jgi:hypothetical protein|uniref:PRC-barrel domain-containing protein n=1 Tax=Hyphomicrobium sp. TaxID=82 RepID=UPI0035694FBE